MTRMQTLKKWRVMTHDQRNEFINEFSVGSIDNSDQPVELFKVEDGILAMDPEDINEPQPFLTIYELAYFYEWDNIELLKQKDEHKYGTTKDVLIKLININLGK